MPPAPPGPFPFRVVRTEGRFGLVSVPHTSAAAARARWGAVPPAPPRPGLRLLRSYGTLRKGKAWLARQRL